MPYIGRDLNRGNYLKLDDISSSFNGSTQTFNLTVGGSAFTPGSAFSILVSVGGVIQEPESAYQVENSEITFANAPTAQDSFFCIALGVALGIGVPGNGTVNGAHLAKPFNYDGYFYLDDTNNRVGIGSLAPTSTLDVRGDAKISGILTATSYSGPISNPSGISTFYNLRVSNNLTVEGTTTTLDTNVTGVDRIEINANSNTDTAIVGIQSGTANLVNLYDGTKEVVTIDDEGNVGIGTGILHTSGAHAGTHQLTVTGQNPSMTLGLSNTDQLYIRRELADGKYTFQTNQGGGNGGNILFQPYGGNVGIRTGAAVYPLDVNGITRLREQVYVNGNFIELNNGGDSQYVINRGVTQLFSIRNNSTAGVHINTQNSALLCLGVSTTGNNGTVESTITITHQDRVGINDQTPDGALDVNGQTHLDDVSISGVSTFAGDLTISSILPRITLNDTNNESDYEIKNENGSFRIRDIDNPTDRYRINSSGGTIHEFFGTANFSSSISVSSGNITASDGGVLINGTGGAILYLNDSDDNPDYQVQNIGGVFGINDSTNNAIRLRIDSNGYIGINDNDSTVGLSINKFGTQPVTNGNTYPYPAGNWSTVWNTTTANNTDYWCGFVGGYNVSSATVNISLSPNVFNLNTQQGIYIAGEATSASLADFTLGKIIGGSQTGASDSAGAKRATKSEMFRINSSGQIITNGSSANAPYATRGLTIQPPTSQTNNYVSIIAGNTSSVSGITFGTSADNNANNYRAMFEYYHSGFAHNEGLRFLALGTEKLRIRGGSTNAGDVLYGPGDFHVGASPGLVNGLGSHHNNNVGSVLFGINDGGGYNGIRVENFDDGTYNSQRIKFLTGKGGVSMATVRMTIDENGYIGIGTDAATNGAKLEINSGTETNASNQYDGQNFSLVIRANKGNNANDEGNGICFAQKFAGGNDSIIRTGAIIGIKDSATGNYGGGLLFKTQAHGANAMVDVLRITSAGNVGINESTNINARLHVQHDALSEKILHATRYNDQANDKPIFAVTETQMTGMTSSGLIIGNHNRDIHIGQVFDSSGNMDGSNNIGLRITYEGKTELYPKVGNNSNTQFTFTNSASTPYIQVKTNNVADGAAIYFGEDNSGAHIKFLTKRRSGAQNSGSLLSVLDLDPYGRVLTADAGGSLKTYPLVSGASIGSSGAEIGQFNYHDMRSPIGELGGWVLLGVDYHGAHPYPRKAYKITKHENGAQGTRVYQIWHDGDANYHYGGMWELRVNEWGSTNNKHESVHFRCVNGRRNDVSVLVQPDGNGLWLMPHTIWGRFFIRRAGWDDSMRTRGSDYCAVTNGAALASGTVQTGVGGSIPGYDYASGNPNPTYHEVFPFDGAGGSHTGGYYIENSTTSAG